MITLLIIVMIASVIVMARFFYAQTNRVNYTWISIVILGPLVSAGLLALTLKVIGQGMIAGVVLLLLVGSIATIPGAIIGWICADNNAKRTCVFFAPAVSAISKIAFNFCKGLYCFFLGIPAFLSPSVDRSSYSREDSNESWDDPYSELYAHPHKERHYEEETQY